jgi:hypothetical protein
MTFGRWCVGRLASTAEHRTVPGTRWANIAAVQRQLGHRHAVYAMQYARVSHEQLGHVLDDR